MIQAAVFISYRAAIPDGDGGNHRSYQILLDLQAEFGCDRVHTLTTEEWLEGPDYRSPSVPKGIAGIRYFPQRMRRRLARMTENPYKLLTREGWSPKMRFGTQGILSQEFIAHYLRRLRSFGGADLCVVDHPIFDQIRRVNAQLGMFTIIASQNLESLDVGRLRLDPARAAHTAAIDLANELRSLARYDERLAISKVEASLLTGVGLSCQFYPYVPSGEVRDRLWQIASMRLKTPSDPGLFLLIGTANHPPTRRSLEWFSRHALSDGLPEGARVVVVGNKLAEVFPNGLSIPGLELRGRVPDEEFSALLIRARAALVPQRMGFGALTRIPEMACAGLPVLAFPHATYPMNLPPGLQVLPDDSWTGLVEGLRASMEHQSTIDPAAYVGWENQQARPLGQLIRRLITKRAAANHAGSSNHRVCAAR